MISITIVPRENGAALVTVGPFTDEDGNAVTPTSLVWTLSTADGATINDKEYVEVDPAPTVEFLLLGDDLPFPGKAEYLLITIDATYTSVIGGETVTGIPLREQAKFSVEHLVVARPE